MGTIQYQVKKTYRIIFYAKAASVTYSNIPVAALLGTENLFQYQRLHQLLMAN